MVHKVKVSRTLQWDQNTLFENFKEMMLFLIQEF